MPEAKPAAPKNLLAAAAARGAAAAKAKAAVPKRKPAGASAADRPLACVRLGFTAQALRRACVSQ